MPNTDLEEKEELNLPPVAPEEPTEELDDMDGGDNGSLPTE